jgi:hypothetical protein
MTEETLDLGDALASNYMLVALNIRTWSGKRTDREATAEVIQNKAAAQDSGSFVKKLLASADGELKEVHAAANNLRSFLYARTLPWTMNTEGAKRGERLVATSDAMQFLADVAGQKRAFDAAVLNLQTVWDSRVQQAITNLGGLADSTDYPDSTQLTNLFSVSVEIRPLPAKQDFSRMNVPSQLAGALAKRMADQHETQVKNAMDDLKGRFLDELQRMATQMGKLASGEKTKLYGTLLTNMTGLVGLARSMNLTGSEKLNEIADKIETQLLHLPLETYKTSITAAEAAANAAKELTAEIENVFY